MTFTPDDLSQNQKERLAFLELKLYFSGELRRSDIECRFGVKPAAASRDLALYREWAAQNIEYDQLARCYRPTRGFVPLFPFQPDRVLSWLSQGFGDGLELKLKTLAPYEGPGQLFRPCLARRWSSAAPSWHVRTAWPSAATPSWRRGRLRKRKIKHVKQVAAVVAA